MRITDVFIRRPILAIVVNLVILIAGLQALRGVSVDLERSKFTAIMSHRSGETEDVTIADLAVETNCFRCDIANGDDITCNIMVGQPSTTRAIV